MEFEFVLRRSSGKFNRRGVMMINDFLNNRNNGRGSYSNVPIKIFYCVLHFEDTLQMILKPLEYWH